MTRGFLASIGFLLLLAVALLLTALTEAAHGEWRSAFDALSIAVLMVVIAGAMARVKRLEAAIRSGAPHLCADLGIKREAGK